MVCGEIPQGRHRCGRVSVVFLPEFPQFLVSILNGGIAWSTSSPSD